MKNSWNTECPSTGLRKCIVDCAGLTLYRYKQCNEKDNQLQHSALLLPGVPVALPKSDVLDFSTQVFALIVIPVFISNLLRDRTIWLRARDFLTQASSFDAQAGLCNAQSDWAITNSAPAAHRSDPIATPLIKELFIPSSKPLPSHKGRNFDLMARASLRVLKA